jgi:hypothetical protein
VAYGRGVAQRRPSKHPSARRRPRYSAARRRRRLVLVALVLVIVIPGALLVALAAGSDGGEDRPALTAAELEAYTGAVHPVLSRGGQVVERDMKPAVRVLAEPRADAKAVREGAPLWVRRLTTARADVAAVPPPPALAGLPAMFDRALELYIQAAGLLGAAARTTGDERTRTLDEAVAKARAADRAYDDASRVIQDWRRRLGLDPSPQFPDPSPSAT